MKCRCSLHRRILGDGCEVCHPERIIAVLKNEIASYQKLLAECEGYLLRIDVITTDRDNNKIDDLEALREINKVLDQWCP